MTSGLFGERNMIRNKWMVRTTIVAMSALAIPMAAIGATPSQFEDVSVKVSFADLNIQSDAGAKVLYSRLKRASEDACDLDSYARSSGLSEYQKARECYEQALEDAVASIDSDALQQIHES
jgi:UrcA family protein